MEPGLTRFRAERRRGDGHWKRLDGTTDRLAYLGLRIAARRFAASHDVETRLLRNDHDGQGWIEVERFPGRKRPAL